MRKIVLLASTGQVGFELNRQLQPLGQVITVGRHDVNFSDTDALTNYIDKLQPDIIVNAAAYTAVDNAESDSDNAYAINRDLPSALAQLSKSLDAWLVHYSTDYVYPGNGDTPWKEDSKTGPVNLYGASKLAGDNAIAGSTDKYLIFRTSWVYAARGNNFLLSMLRLGGERESLNIVNDQIGAPTPARLIASVSILCLQQVLREAKSVNAKKYSGVYHLAANGYTSWYGFAKKIFDEARRGGMSLAIKPEGLGEIATEAYPTPAARPKNSRLDLSKIEQTFGITLPSWESQVVLTLQEVIK